MQSEKRRQQRRDAARTWRAKQGPDKLKELNRGWRENAKRGVFEAYGSKCACCGESNPKFLTIDHIDNDGYRSRDNKNEGRGWNFYCWIKRNNFPKNLQILCWNCNCGRAYNGGICPHKEVS